MKSKNAPESALMEEYVLTENAHAELTLAVSYAKIRVRIEFHKHIL